MLRARRRELTVAPTAAVPRLSVDGAELAVDVDGDGAPAVVLVHGALCSRADWANQQHALRDEFRVIAVDLRGHGSSTGAPRSCSIEQFARDVREVVTQLDASPAVFVGHSMGARVVLELAARFPAEVAGLVLVDGSRMFGPGAVASPDRADALVDEEVRRRFGLTVEEAIGPVVDPSVREHVVTTMLGASTELMRHVLATWQAWDVERYEETLHAIDPALPVLALQSTYVDAATPRRSMREGETTPYLEFLRASLPALQVHVLARVGHFSMLEAPDAVSESVAGFAAALRGGASRRA